MAGPESGRRIPARLRRLAASVAFLTAFWSLTGGNPFPDFRGRLEILRRSWKTPLATRRREGSAAAYDRRFAALVDSARGALPPGTPGLALDAPGIPEWGGSFLAVYQFAPIPVFVDSKRVPPGWLVLRYGRPEPPDGRILWSGEGGALIVPRP